MFVSILQLMGFPVGKPVHSRAKEVTQSLPSKARIEGLKTSVSDVHVQTNSARRQKMKTQASKVKVVPKAAKVVAKGRPAAKAVAKAKARPAVKAKPTVKAKPAVKARPAVKAKPAVKATVKPQVKKALPAQASVKVAVRGKEPKSTVKVAAKAPKTVSVKAVKATAKVKTKDSVKTMIAKAGKPHVVAPKKPKVVSAATAVKTPVVAPVAVATPSVPARAGRPSSRLAQLTVPSMAQSVASTAAKASFTQTTTSPLIVPPLASAIKKDPKLANNWKSKPLEQLTDAELIAMPDDEYMNETQMAFFRRKLVQLKKDILSNAGETTEHLREDTVVVPDPADRATIEEEHALELRTRDRERKLLKKIEQSIQRIDSGDYGYCDETGEPIGVARLLARPTANLSLEAQQRRELKQKMFGD
jgi:DnaK suppressor protein